MAFPVRISTKNRANVGVPMGPWLMSGAWYAFVLNGTTSRISISKSTDEGLTWTYPDSTNAILTSQNPRYSVTQVNATTLRIVYGDNLGGVGANNTGKLHVKDFSTATDTYSAAVDSTIAWGLGGIADPAPSIISIQVGTDTYIIFINRTGLSQSQLRYAVYSTGIFGSPIDITATAVNTQVQPQTALLGPDGMIKIPYNYENPVAAVNVLRYATISSGGSVNSGSTIVSAFSGTSGPMEVFNSFVFLPVIDSTVPGSGNPFVVLTIERGSPYTSITPSWTLVSGLDTNTYASGTAYKTRPLMMVVNGTIFLVWSVFSFSNPSSNTQLWYTSSTDGLVWGAPVKLFDLATTPAGWTGTGPIEEISFGVVGNTLVFTGNINSDGTATLAELEVPLPPLVLLCNNPPQGIVSVAYSHQLIASGGEEPYTFEIISGSLPPGLLLDEDTGIISGIPILPGTYTFTVQLTDSQAPPQTTTVTCSILIIAPTITCPDLVNPQIPGFIQPIDADTERYLRRFINDMNSAMTPSDQN